MYISVYILSPFSYIFRKKNHSPDHIFATLQKEFLMKSFHWNSSSFKCWFFLFLVTFSILFLFEKKNFKNITFYRTLQYTIVDICMIWIFSLQFFYEILNFKHLNDFESLSWMESWVACVCTQEVNWKNYFLFAFVFFCLLKITVFYWCKKIILKIVFDVFLVSQWGKNTWHKSPKELFFHCEIK